jgi:hypothetical protein
MAALDFPPSPTPGTVYGKYTWDGDKWGITPTAAGGGITQADADLRYVDVAGDTMTGHLTLPTTPAAANAVRKDYVDTALAGTVSQSYVDTQDALRLLKTANLSDVANVVASRQSIYAAPFDAMSYNGLQVNGCADVSQELGFAGFTLTSANNANWACDGWKVGIVQGAGAVSFTASQGSSGGLVGMSNAVVATINNSNFNLATNGDCIYIRHQIEGYRAVRLGWGTAVPNSLSYGMWFLAPIAGTFGIRVFNQAFNRTYYIEHTVPVGWSWVSGTIAGETSGTWVTNNGVGIYFDILVSGKDAAPAAPSNGVWSTAAIKTATTGMTNLMGTSGNQARVTGLILVPGNEVPSAARAMLIARRYDQELPLCQRYLQKIGFGPEIAVGDAITGVQHPGIAVTTTIIGIIKQFVVPMRAAPTTTTFYRGVSGASVGKWSYYNGVWIDAASMSVNTVDTNQIGINMNFAGGLTAGLSFTTQGGALLDARL